VAGRIYTSKDGVLHNKKGSPLSICTFRAILVLTSMIRKEKYSMTSCSSYQLRSHCYEMNNMFSDILKH